MVHSNLCSNIIIIIIIVIILYSIAVVVPFSSSIDIDSVNFCCLKEMHKICELKDR